MRWKHGAAILALGLTASCGGGGGGSGTIAASAPTPAPSPTPSPTPTTVFTQYQVEGAGPVFAELHFYPNGVVPNGAATFSAATTDRDGVYLSLQTTPPTPGWAVDDGSFALAAFGMDNASGLPLIQLKAPAGSTVVSPLTTLIYETGNQGLTKHALQLDALFALGDPGRDLRNFSWVRAARSANTADISDAHRVRAANIRLHALGYAITQFRAGPYYPFSYQSLFPPDIAALAAALKADPTLRLYTDAGTEALLRALPRYPSNSAAYRDDVIAAAAHLITLYCVAIGPVASDDDIAASYMLGVQGYLLRALWELTNANTAAAAARVQAMGISDIYSAVAPFAEHPALSSNKLFAVPDFFFVAPGGTVTIPFYDPGSNGSAALASNDFTWFVQPDGYPLSLVGTTIPSRFATAIAVTSQADGALSIQAKPGFSGVAWFDYEVRTPSGIAASSRAFVVVR